jgi:hypothetical protein
LASDKRQSRSDLFYGIVRVVSAGLIESEQMGGSTTQFLSDQLDSYTESWQRDHADALACWELEARLKIALGLFQAIRLVDQEMSQAVAEGRLSWDAVTTERLVGFYRSWEAPAGAIVRRARDLRSRGFEVEGAVEFERAALEAKGTLNISLDRLEQSARQAREGKLRPLGEIRDELRRQSDFRG